METWLKVREQWETVVWLGNVWRQRAAGVGDSPCGEWAESRTWLSNCAELNLWWEGFSSGSDGKESACNTGDMGSVSGSGRSPAEGNINPLQYSCLGNPMDRGAWWAIGRGVAKESDILNNNNDSEDRSEDTGQSRFIEEIQVYRKNLLTCAQVVKNNNNYHM